MSNNNDTQSIVDYDSDLIGTIKSHLEALQGYDVMALEIIQNADDAKANEIIFDIRKDGLQVWNSGEFSYCGNLSDRICRLQQTEKYACDFHRIKKVASGGKLKKSENIGRFGIGFVSTYQIADHPEIQSSGVKLVLLPETENAAVQTIPETVGTTLFLPWATDPNTDARQALGVSHVRPTHIDQLTNDIQSVLRKSVKYEEVYLHGYDTVSIARQALSQYFDFYNRRRPHSSLDGKTPDMAYFNLSKPPLAAAA